MINAELMPSRSAQSTRSLQSTSAAREVELVQIDDSPHNCFVGRGPRCTLIVFIDDATAKLQVLHFCSADSTQAHMQTRRINITRLGRPVALDSDKHSIFRVNHAEYESAPTQLSRALRELGIEPIQANTPQAKGRVERANQTLQWIYSLPSAPAQGDQEP